MIIRAEYRCRRIRRLKEQWEDNIRELRAHPPPGMDPERARNSLNPLASLILGAIASKRVGA